MNNRTPHIDPIRATLPFSKKVEYAKLLSARKKIALRENAYLRYPEKSTVIFICIAQVVTFLAIIAAVVILIIGLGNESARTNSASNQGTTTNNSASSGSGNSSSSGGTVDAPLQSNNNSAPNTNGSNSNAPATETLPDKVRSALLSAYSVTDFSEITDPELASSIKNITQSSAGKITVRLGIEYSKTTRASLRSLATTLMDKVKNQVQDLQTIICVTNDNYYIEVANR
ncbi:MAG: hypothetical protein LBQ41_02725 [Candidatus Ancillula sp.]|nr:hypothetical protein [Candidatus Ancillula sp.]